MRIGMLLSDVSGGRSSLDDIVDAACWADDVGLASVWLPYLPWSVDPLVALTIVGRATHRVELGTAVVPTYPTHPMAMARTAMTVDAAVGGRLVLGLGPSHPSVIESMYGMSYASPARHVREYVTALRQAFDGERSIAVDGSAYSFRSMYSVPGGTAPTLMIAALAPLMLRIAGELADGTVLWFAEERAIAEHVVPRLRAAAEAVDRPMPRVVAMLPMAVGDDVGSLRDATDGLFGNYLSIPTYQRILARGAAASPADLAILGDEAAVGARVDALAEAGATDLVFAPFGVGADASARAASLERARACLAEVAAARR